MATSPRRMQKIPMTPRALNEDKIFSNTIRSSLYEPLESMARNHCHALKKIKEIAELVDLMLSPVDISRLDDRPVHLISLLNRDAINSDIAPPYTLSKRPMPLLDWILTLPSNQHHKILE